MSEKELSTMRKVKRTEIQTGKQFLENEQNMKENIIIPRHAMGMYPVEVLVFVFGMLPMFSKLEEELFLTMDQAEISKITGFSKKELVECFKKVNKSNLFLVKKEKGDSYKINLQEQEMENFLHSITNFNLIFAKKENTSFLEENKLSLGAVGLLAYLLENKNIKTTTNEIEFLEQISVAKTDDYVVTAGYLKELKENGYFYDFDIVDKQKLKKLRRVQVLTNVSMEMKEAKQYIPLDSGETVFFYPVGEVE